MDWPVGRFPDIPEYVMININASINLREQPKQLCFFHKDTNTPSFSYSTERECWSCFGACKKIGKDVIDMHQIWFKFNTRAEAEASLRYLCRCPKILPKSLVTPRIVINEEEVEQKQLIQEAIVLATTPERWLDLDYAMSKYPVSTNELFCLVKRWKEC